MTTNTKPNPHFVLQRESGDLEIFMSFGLLNTLSKYIADLTELDAILTNPEVRISILIECLSQRDKNGRIVDELDFEALNLSPNEGFEILEWVTGHVADFFLQALKGANKIKSRLMTEVKTTT